MIIDSHSNTKDGRSGTQNIAYDFSDTNNVRINCIYISNKNKDSDCKYIDTTFIASDRQKQIIKIFEKDFYGYLVGVRPGGGEFTKNTGERAVPPSWFPF